MPALEEILASLKTWEQQPDGDNLFKLACRIDPGASLDDIESSMGGRAAPPDLTELWLASREAWLFEDVDYGQWGLHLLNSSDSAVRTATEHAARPDDLRADDIVLGEFLGDSELLVYAPSEEGPRRYLISLPLDSRDDWYAAGATAAEVFERYAASGGEKYWEQGLT